MEEELHCQYRELCDKSLKVKYWWFKAKSCDLMKELHPKVDFKFSDGWFTAFKRRYSINYCSSTNVGQRQPSELENVIEEFHKQIRSFGGEKKGVLSQHELQDIVIMDQTPLPFTFNKGKGYDDKGTKTVWHCGAASGLEKRQCTVQLTILADGKTYVKPLVIFSSKGLRISDKEKKQYDSRVVVHFQENAWCDEKIMMYWIKSIWKRPFRESEKLICFMLKQQSMLSRYLKGTVVH